MMGYGRENKEVLWGKKRKNEKFGVWGILKKGLERRRKMNKKNRMRNSEVIRD